MWFCIDAGTGTISPGQKSGEKKQMYFYVIVAQFCFNDYIGYLGYIGSEDGAGVPDCGLDKKRVSIAYVRY